MIARTSYINQIVESLEIFPICALLGSRQVGKTTLALSLKDKYEEVHHFDLEDPTDLAAFDSPKLVLQQLKGLVIIDEIQRRAELFPYLRTLVDSNKDIKLLILGSASRELIHQSSETLSGRIYYIHVSPFMIDETPDKNIDILWSRGGYPRSYLAASEEASYMWRKAYISTFLERDMQQLGFNLSPQTMRKVWTMLAHYHGNIMNYSELSRSLSISDKTIKDYIDILDGTFMVRVLKPWFVNISKRQVKAPKIYIRDSGLLHCLLGIQTQELKIHPKAGASWEGFAIEEIIHYMRADAEDCYYWRTQKGAELDLLIYKDGKKHGYEFKYTDSPTVNKSMYSAIEDLALDSIDIIVPGNKSFKLKDNINVVGIETLYRK